MIHKYINRSQLLNVFKDDFINFIPAMSSLSCALYRIHSTTLVPALLRSSSISRPPPCSLGSITKGGCSFRKFNSAPTFWGFGFSTRIAGYFVSPRSMGSVTGSQNGSFAKPRVVVKKVLSKEQPEGDGATVRRSIGRPELKQLDPFLMLDYFSAHGPAGFPDHPHRGFETVTYMLEGAFCHQDFKGHKGTIHAGDVQWMTAGRGIVHCEMPATKGLQRGLQLWVNLSSKDKMIEPKYQELQEKDIPRVDEGGVKVIIIAGESFGVKSPVYTRTPTMYLDFTLQPGAVVHQAVPEGWNAFTFVLEGDVVFGKEDSRPTEAFHTVVFSNGDGLSAWNKGAVPTRFVLVAGKPLNEPVAQYGPFVMNTQAELTEAVYDFRSGRNGFENAHTWRSDPVTMS